MKKIMIAIILASITFMFSTILTAKSITLEPHTTAFADKVDQQPPPDFSKLTPKDTRAGLSDLQSAKVDLSDMDVSTHILPVGPHSKTKVVFYRPKHLKGDLPVLIYLHGGGWVNGDRYTHERLVSQGLSKCAGIVVAFIDYERAPEAAYPIALMQTVGVLKYLHKHAGEFGIDKSNISIGGDSAGANIAIAATLKTKDKNDLKLRSQVLFYPVTDASMNTPSYKEFANGPLLTKKAMAFFWSKYVPVTKANVKAKVRQSIFVSPINATTSQLAGLPPALIITAENDVLRDEGEDYARHLIKAGVRTEATRYIGTIHDFVMLNVLAKTPASIGATQQACSFIKRETGK